MKRNLNTIIPWITEMDINKNENKTTEFGSGQS